MAEKAESLCSTKRTSEHVTREANGGQSLEFGVEGEEEALLLSG